MLYVVATPLGNLEDITLRARRVLGEVSVIACEDTRHSRTLLTHLGLNTPLVSYHEHNEAARTQELLQRLQAGEDVALISDAGTPCISDPGYRLVAACAEAGLTVSPIPGPAAVIAALSASGLPTDTFHFVGFLPREGKRRRRALEGLCELPGTLVFYESPHRIVGLLEDAEATLGARRCCVAREITKLHEEMLRGTCGELALELSTRERVRGEITCLIEGAPSREEESSELDPHIPALIEALRGEGLSARSIRDVLVATYGLKRKVAYALAMGS